MLEGRENIFKFFEHVIDHKCDENNYRVVKLAKLWFEKQVIAPKKLVF